MKHVEKAEDLNIEYSILYIAYVWMCCIIDNDNLLLCSMYHNNIKNLWKIYVTMTRYCVRIKLSTHDIVIKESYQFV